VKIRPVQEAGGAWKCPLCSFRAMSKKVVEQHIADEHKESVKKLKELKEKKKEAKKKKKKVGNFVEGDFLSRICSTHSKVKVKMLTGEEFIGTIEDYTIFMLTLKRNGDGKPVYIYKQGIAYIEPAD